MKKTIIAILVSMVMLGGSILNVSAVAENVCWHELMEIKIENRMTLSCHDIEDVNTYGCITLIGCTITTIDTVRVVRCASCGAVKSETVTSTITKHQYLHD